MSTKQVLLDAIEHLPESQLLDVLHYIRSLQAPSAELSSGESHEPQPDDRVDPLFDFIGAVSHASLATDLDDELYDE